MRYLKRFNESNKKEFLSRGDLVKLRSDIDRNDDDGEYGFSINKDEIGEIRYLVNQNENPDYYNQIYMVSFKDDKEKQGSKSRGRIVQAIRTAFEEIN